MYSLVLELFHLTLCFVVILCCCIKKFISSQSIKYALTSINLDYLQHGNIMNYVDISILVYVCDAHEYIFSVEYRQRSKTDESQGMHKYRFTTY